MSAPNITTREIDSSVTSNEAQPTGRAAGVIGTAEKGVAFVPTTFANASQFQAEFGVSSADRTAPVGMYEWLRNASAGTYVRVLGAGDGKKRAAGGSVTNAGFVVGSQQVQSSGQLGNNPYATVTGLKGRTYFLGCYMSESAGSWVFSESGLQSTTAAVPVVRGVLLAASGVQITLSSSAAASAGASTSAVTSPVPVAGWFTGSVDLRSGKQQFSVLLNGKSSDSEEYPSVITASFNPKDPAYFANVFNTDPFATERHGYCLYAHFDVLDALAAPTGSGIAAQALVRRFNVNEALEEIAFCLTGSEAYNTGTASVPNFEGFEDRFSHPVTPYIISQNFGGSPKNLFRIHARGDGADLNTSYKVSIKNIKSPTSPGLYGKFTVDIRDWNDTDNQPVILESYVDCDLDPDSDAFVGKKIGDQNTYFDFDRVEGSQKVVEEGLYGKVSRRVRIEISDDVANKLVPTTTLPVGFRGPYSLVTSGALGVTGLLASVGTAKQPPVPFRRHIAVNGAQASITAVGESKLHWGVQFDVANSLTRPNDGSTTATAATRDATVANMTKYFPKFQTTIKNVWQGDSAAADSFNNNKFSLERIQVQTGVDGLIDPLRWDEAVYQRDAVLDSTLGGRFIDVDTDFAKAADRSYLKFTTIMQGGFDGLNIFNRDKFYMTDAAVRREMDNANQGQLNGSTVAAYRKAIDIMADKSFADVHLLAIPGQRNPVVTDYAISAVENRFDAMYIMDVEHKDESNSFVTASLSVTDYPNVNLGFTTARFTSRGLSTSFAATYFPDAVMADPVDSSKRVRVPASVPVLGAFAQNDSIGFSWSAPAGYNRTVLNVQQLGTLLLKENIDTVYDAGINPLLATPGAGIIINGQRTLLAEGSSLDRINVRRLLIEVRRRVRPVAESLLFEPNRESTIARFNSLVTPIMKQVQAQRGVERYRVQIDTSTTTQADIENNTIRGKIYLQPTKSAEFISIDFEARNAGNF